MFGWIAYVRKNRLLARVEELEDRVEELHQRAMRRQSAEDMRALRAQRKTGDDARLHEEAAAILQQAGSGKGSPAGSTQGVPKQQLWKGVA